MTGDWPRLVHAEGKQPLLSLGDFAQQGTERDDEKRDDNDGDDPHGRPPLNRRLNLLSFSRSWEAGVRFMLFSDDGHELLLTQGRQTVRMNSTFLSLHMTDPRVRALPSIAAWDLLTLGENHCDTFKLSLKGTAGDEGKIQNWV